MANAVKWEALVTDRGNVLSTELNALANGSRSAAGSAINNGSNLDQYGWLQLDVDFVSSPSAGAYVEVWMVKALNGTDYEDGSDSVDPGAHTLVAIIPVRATTAAQKLMSRTILLPPCPIKFLLTDRTGQAFPASGSTLKLYTANDEVQ